MNLLGKIFTVLILLMSVCFFMISVMVGASQHNWKEQALGLKKLIEDERDATAQANSRLDENKVQLQHQMVARQKQVAYLQSLIEANKKTINDLNTELSAQLELAKKRADLLQEAQNQIKTLDKNIGDLRADNKTKSDTIAGMVNRTVELTNSIYELDHKIQNLNATKNVLAQQMAVYKRVMTTLEIDPHAPLTGIQPPVASVVTAIEDDLLTFGIGNDDGILKDKEVYITRKGRYLATAVIIKIKDNEAAARLIPETVEAPVEKGDRISTTLKP